jgi:hypothetical protein
MDQGLIGDVEVDVIARLLSEDRISVSSLAKELDLHVGTVIRWCTSGTLASGSRRRVKLEHFRMGGSIHTSRQAFRRYVAALNSSGGTVGEAPGARTAAQRRRDAEAASREASRLGC